MLVAALRRGEGQPVLNQEAPNITVGIKHRVAREFQHLPISCGTGAKMSPLIWNLPTFSQRFAIRRLILLISGSKWCTWAPQRTTERNPSLFFERESDGLQCINSVRWWIAISVTEAGSQSQRGRICLYDFFGSNQCFMLDCYMKPWKKWTWKNIKNVCFTLLVHFTARFYGDIQWWLS